MKRVLVVCAAVLALSGVGAIVPTSVKADNLWGGYHWARTSNPFQLKVGDNVGSAWQSYFNAIAPSSGTGSYWTVNGIVQVNGVPGKVINPKNCKATRGRVEVCNATYGFNGWLGVAQVWVSGLHITQATVRLNDSYYNSPSYDTYGWRQMVMCQEVGHTLGLDHQDEGFNPPNIGTCMDYTSNPDGGNVGGTNWGPNNYFPDAHDYSMLQQLYSHTDSSSTAFMSLPPPAMNQIQLDDPPQWGRQVRNNGRVAVFDADFGNGHHVISFVIWAQ